MFAYALIHSIFASVYWMKFIVPSSPRELSSSLCLCLRLFHCTDKEFEWMQRKKNKHTFTFKCHPTQSVCIFSNSIHRVECICTESVCNVALAYLQEKKPNIVIVSYLKFIRRCYKTKRAYHVIIEIIIILLSTILLLLYCHFVTDSMRLISCLFLLLLFAFAEIKWNLLFVALTSTKWDIIASICQIECTNAIVDLFKYARPNGWLNLIEICFSHILAFSHFKHSDDIEWNFLSTKSGWTHAHRKFAYGNIVCNAKKRCMDQIFSWDDIKPEFQFLKTNRWCQCTADMSNTLMKWETK